MMLHLIFSKPTHIWRTTNSMDFISPMRPDHRNVTWYHCVQGTERRRSVTARASACMPQDRLQRGLC